MRCFLPRAEVPVAEANATTHEADPGSDAGPPCHLLDANSHTHAAKLPSVSTDVTMRAGSGDFSSNEGTTACTVLTAMARSQSD